MRGPAESFGYHAVDKDCTDASMGTVTTTVDPKKGEGKGSYTYDPLNNRTSRRRWNLASGFTRVPIPIPMMVTTDNPVTDWWGRATRNRPGSIGYGHNMKHGVGWGPAMRGDLVLSPKPGRGCRARGHGLSAQRRMFI
ncbi:hypothetical protein P7K49_013121 [Saguinus oedipus]|uniref:Uncharacterized protein n=1 Tax=Saguinus oedipus TaxID=9490 RepID=A0ABQ9VF99_SAGOE|nr:hypothetical protein P7K49_013110 [Saguinus oedipus]KAK2107956.1 hypothetical protein P7K49_013121 [Saguinus oedipus]